MSIRPIPYEYGSTSLFSLLPPPYLKLGRSELKSALGSESERRIIKAMMEEGKGWDSIASLCGWDDIKVLVLHSNPQYEGLSMNEVAQLRNQDPYEAFFDVLVQEEGSALMTDVTQSQDSIKRILSHPLMCFGTDALYAGQKAHPRSYQAALHLLERYWKQEPVLSLEQLIAKMTSCGAKRLGLADRGLVSKGYKADLVLFDPVELADRSDEMDTRRTVQRSAFGHGEWNGCLSERQIYRQHQWFDSAGLGLLVSIEESLRPGIGRVVEQLVRTSFLDDQSIVHEDDTV
jgi:N-acyl-D-aspartate/D-glutamate deacylase